MDRHSGKRSVTGSIVPRKAYKVAIKDTTTPKDQFCNRIGCQGRIKYSNQNSKIGSSDNTNRRKPLCSSNKNKNIGNSSRTSSLVTEAKGSNLDTKAKGSNLDTKAKSSNVDTKRKLASQSEFDPSESSQSGDSSIHQSESSNTPRDAKSGASSMPSSIRPRKLFQPKQGSNVQHTQSASVSNKSRCLKNLKCNSISDVVPSKSVVKNVIKKRSPDAESSMSRRGRNTTDRHTPVSTSGVSISAFRRSGEDAASVRTRMLTYANQNRTGLTSYRQNGTNISFSREPSFRTSFGFLGSRPPNSVGSSSLLHQSASGSSSDSSSYGLFISNDENHSPLTSADLGFGHFMNREALHRYNMNGGMTEVLLELGRIEQDQEMTHEQIYALEASLYLSNRSMYDQHRDMRLDIDNMSYEELLALGDKMGTVSTALSEDALTKCVKRSIYQTTSSEELFTGSGGDGDDVNCSICQEEYETGDEVGKLVECQHVYHTACINHWLRLKNWCPICKTAAAAPQESS